MSLLTKSPVVAGGLAAALFAIAVLIMLNTGGRPAAPKRSAYFVVEDGGELIVSAMTPGPITDPSGRSAVRAYVFTCGSCADAATRFVGYVEKHSPEALAQLNLSEPDTAAIRKGHLVSGGERPWQWIAYDSPAGQQMIMALRGRCRELKSCEP